MWACFKTDVFFFSTLNQLGKVNELLIKPDLSDSTEEKEEDVEEESVEEESGSKADCVFTTTSLETALNMVNLPPPPDHPTPQNLSKWCLTFYYTVFISSGGDAWS